MKIKIPTTKRLAAIAGSDRFFWAVVVLLVLQAAWIALSGRYPMAFDEDFHLGIIRLYAHHLSPFWSGHPAGGNAFGAVARDPSYLYHYLMSFPYRFIDFFTSSQAVQVLLLRGLNIGLFAWGLTLYRRLLNKTGAARVLVHLSLLMFVLVPIVPLLAAQINYDNLLLPLTALALLFTLRLRDGLANRSVDVKSKLALGILCLLTSLVKYAFLPIFAVIVVYLVIQTLRSFGSFRQLRAAILKGWRALGKWTATGLVVGLILSASLFVERYGVNVIRYHTPVADCAQVLDYDHCQYYGPWIRDHNFELNKPADTDRKPISFTQHWFYGMWFRSFFAVDGPATQFQTRGPLLIPGISAIIFASLGGVAFLLAAKRLWRRYNSSVLWLFTSVAVVYLAILWVQQYQLFLQTGRPVAINGRYLLPLLPLLVLMTAMALNEVLGARERLKTIFAAIIILCFVWGGGALTYILRSNDAWYWPNTPLKTANHAVQRVLGPVTPGDRNTIQFLH